MVGVFGASKNAVPPHRDPVVLREQILYQLRKVIDPDLYKDIVSCGFVKDLQFNFDTGTVAFTLQLTTPTCPVKDEFVHQCTELLKELGWIETVNITLSAQSQKATFVGDASKNLKNVSFIIAVSSCKGGVGKSSMAVNIAYMLKSLGASVGICDCDVYGPSLHTLIPIPQARVYFQPEEKEENSTDVVRDSLAKGEGVLIPLEYEGVKLMSYSYFRPSDDAYAGVRGPIASNLVYQMVCQTKWDSLDYLVLDMPPGTGDIHLTVCQSIRISGAVVVTTPQQLSLIDMMKGAHFYEKMNIPTIALIENMAYIECRKCLEETEIFQSTYSVDSVEGKENASEIGPCHPASQSTTTVLPVQRLLDQFGVKLHLRLPLDPRLSAVSFIKNGKAEFPFALAFNEKTKPWKKLLNFCSQLTREISTVVYGDHKTPEIVTTSDGLLQISIQKGLDTYTVYLVPLREVRLHCKCALCINEFTGEAKLNPRSVPIDIHIIRMEQSNNYSVKIQWSDKHDSIMSYQALISLGQECERPAREVCGIGEELEW
eukprot:Gregarina_sp_Poly_1__10904@NODE_850_length_5977_cov_89_644501_g614_i0_p1_GENE_NODE_850_length_5977_cov_89_644501_g614_i0NODE_850_length_5977_cov_89_644501_g614_i0_p1_ORF_typecomplete_len542_score74_40ParA/PF10609_9/4_2e66AAA_31/PF13614_6/2e16DUF971/PF06155_12/1_6e13CBP_BcsQ/PF06564_12/2_5e13FeS_assembly_P/PF01883_19/4_6e13CbiA/PF01656_23/3_3e12MipZ/PF09140_11/1_1e09MipZ/PF09140_11/65VirC1/PF07015_11/2_2e05VirC1/PF07015_11/1e02Fer4_NifH/PF00142_18/0_00016ArsA_ATPase/PF02374_15/0_024ArsA_ATPase/PF